MASYGGFEGILTGLTKSTDHPSRLKGSSKGNTDKWGGPY